MFGVRMSRAYGLPHVAYTNHRHATRAIPNPSYSSSCLLHALDGARAAAAAATVTPTAATTTKKAGIMKTVPVTPELGKFLGVPQVSRTDAVKQVWDYIKLHNLQDPVNEKEIRCDDKLKAIFDGKDKVTFLEIARLLSRHFVKTS